MLVRVLRLDGMARWHRPEHPSRPLVSKCTAGSRRRTIAWTWFCPLAHTDDGFREIGWCIFRDRVPPPRSEAAQWRGHAEFPQAMPKGRRHKFLLHRNRIGARFGSGQANALIQRGEPHAQGLRGQP